MRLYKDMGVPVFPVSESENFTAGEMGKMLSRDRNVTDKELPSWQRKPLEVCGMRRHGKDV
jgi:hypothetical protein